MHFGEKWWVEMHGLEEPIVEVEITENPNGQYYGWLETGKTIPELIMPNVHCFNVCFAYGPQADVDAGQGIIMRFDVRKK
jgi:hypothetical protein